MKRAMSQIFDYGWITGALTASALKDMKMDSLWFWGAVLIAGVVMAVVKGVLIGYMKGTVSREE